MPISNKDIPPDRAALPLAIASSSGNGMPQPTGTNVIIVTFDYVYIETVKRTRPIHTGRCLQLNGVRGGKVGLGGG